MKSWIDVGNIGVYFYLLGSLCFYFNMVRRNDSISLPKGMCVFVACLALSLLLSHYPGIAPFSR
jgi:hypothetical protein